jgi:hypothetical protein
LAAEKISALDERIAALAAMRESLRRLVTTCERPPHRRECPLLTAFADDAVVDGVAAHGE